MSQFRILVAMVCLAAATAGFGLPDDGDQPITIESDFAESNQTTGPTEYIGNVIMRQGSVSIEAEKVTIFYKDSKVNRILSLGEPATYRHQPNINEGIVVAHGEIIEYLLGEDKINLQKNASLARNGTLVKGDLIVYDINKGTWKANGNNRSNQKRIQLVIPPSNLDNSTTEQQESPE